MKKSVGLILITAIPNNEEVLMVVLQRRGQWNIEKMAPESYPGCCQISVHGKLKHNEEFYHGLFREGGEELGRNFIMICQEKLNLEEVSHKCIDGEEILNFGAFIPAKLLRKIRLGPDSGGLDLVRGDNFLNGCVLKITEDMKRYGPPHGGLAMFEDEIQDVKKALEMFSSKRYVEEEQCCAVSC